MSSPDYRVRSYLSGWDFNQHCIGNSKLNKGINSSNHAFTVNTKFK